MRRGKRRKGIGQRDRRRGLGTPYIEPKRYLIVLVDSWMSAPKLVSSVMSAPKLVDSVFE